MTATVENVTAEANSHPIVVFICPTCPYCQKAVSELKNNGFDAKIIDAQPDQRKVLKDMTGASSVPSCWVKGQYVGGCNDGAQSWMGILPMIKSGKLAELLK